MGYDLAIPAAILIVCLAIMLAAVFARRREMRRLDFRKGTTYQEPQEEGTPAPFAREQRDAPSGHP